MAVSLCGSGLPSRGATRLRKTDQHDNLSGDWLQPDVAESNRVSVVLKVDGTWFRTFFYGSRSSTSGQFQMIVDQNSIVLDGDPRIGGFLINVELCGVLFDIVSLA